MKRYRVIYNYNGVRCVDCVLAQSKAEVIRLIMKRLEDEGGVPKKITFVVDECIDAEDW